MGCRGAGKGENGRVILKIPVQEFIQIRGARVHNLKNISLSIPHNQFTVVTGRFRFGEILARLRHDLRRGPAALRGIALGLCPAVSGADGKARRGRYRRHRARHRDPAEKHDAAIRARRSPPRPNATTSCGCCSRGWAGPTARTAASGWSKDTVDQVAARMLADSRGFALVRAVSGDGEHATGAGAARSSLRAAQERL